MTAAQSRGARGLLGWSRKDLAEAAGVSLRTVTSFETGEHEPLQAVRMALFQAYERVGIRFIEGGVRLEANDG